MSNNNNKMDEISGQGENEPVGVLNDNGIIQNQVDANTGAEPGNTGDDAVPTGDSAVPTGDSAVPTGDSAVPTGAAAAPTGAVAETPDTKDTKFYVEIDLTNDKPKVKFAKAADLNLTIDENQWTELDLKTKGGRVTKKRKNAIRKTIHKKKPRNSTSKKHTSTKKRQPKVR